MILKQVSGHKPGTVPLTWACWRQTTGFTWIELLVVLTVILILGALVAPQWGSVQKEVRLPAAAQKLAQDLRYARGLAVTTGTPHRLHILSSTTYQVTRQDGTSVTDPLHGGPYQVDLSQEPYQGVQIQYPTPLSGNYVEFDALGVPRDASGPLNAPVSLALTGGGDTRTVQITPETGQISVP